MRSRWCGFEFVRGDDFHSDGGAASFGVGDGVDPASQAALNEQGHGVEGGFDGGVLAAVGAADVADGDGAGIAAHPVVKPLLVAAFGGEGDLFQHALGFVGEPAGERDATLHTDGVADERIEGFARCPAGEVND